MRSSAPASAAEATPWRRCPVYTMAFAAVGVAGPNLVMHDKNSPYAFTAAKMGHHDIQDPAGDAGEA